MKSHLSKKTILSFTVITMAIVLMVNACKTVDVFEKNTTIPGSEWDRSFKPAVDFTITDTTALYNIYITLRHTYAYKYNNIWLNLQYTLPGDSLKQQKVDVLLGDNQKGEWLGTGMDDLFVVRRLITPQPFRFKRAGNCNFVIEQVMRDNPLKHIMNAGIRVEKVVP